MGVSGAPFPCSNCGFAFLGAQATMAIGSDDTVYVLWNSTVDQTNFAPERIYFAKSTNHGASYSTSQDVSLAALAYPRVITSRCRWMIEAVHRSPGEKPGAMRDQVISGHPITDQQAKTTVLAAFLWLV